MHQGKSCYQSWRCQYLVACHQEQGHQRINYCCIGLGDHLIFHVHLSSAALRLPFNWDCSNIATKHDWCHVGGMDTNFHLLGLAKEWNFHYFALPATLPTV